MIKLIVWGMGKTAKRFQRYLRGDRAEITAFTCSDVQKIGGGVISPELITKRVFDYVIVASSAYREIEDILIQLGVSKDKIHQVYNREKYVNDDVITCFPNIKWIIRCMIVFWESYQGIYKVINGQLILEQMSVIPYFF